ncbi:ATP-binding protein [Clostridium estertheticum]|uniref:AAA family ATPase n=1 Tax=Clostridium estertheticum TaxID=238834 RepID=UPI001C7DC2F6|nr:ATP-binding protein [Clostridium estertheticum]MBX4262623.1 ATP-binding protein [Clostridium estertheticum]WLC71595.1 ATP-binding protein [Clostridium estertheticum]
MPKVMLICGKLCSGKTTYAKKLVKENNAILLSCDEIMLTLFGQYCGDSYDEMQEKTMKYLFKKSLDVVAINIDVILDFGFWSKAKREEATEFYRQNGITPEWHYIDVPHEIWLKNVDKRNNAVENAETNDCYVDGNLANKCISMFEEPTSDEIGVWFKNDWI